MYNYSDPILSEYKKVLTEAWLDPENISSGQVPTRTLELTDKEVEFIKNVIESNKDNIIENNPEDEQTIDNILNKLDIQTSDLDDRTDKIDRPNWRKRVGYMNTTKDDASAIDSTL